MLSKGRIKQIHSLEQKKYRRSEGLFVAEGHKLVGELLAAGHRPVYLCHTLEWCGEVLSVDCPTDLVTEDELRTASLLQHPQQVLALFPLPSWNVPDVRHGKENLLLALDGVQDPGNLGTICRIADWFGIEDIICSVGTVDVFNPKTIQATMGAIARVRVHYIDLEQYLKQARELGVLVYGTFLNGNNIYQESLSPHGVIVMGNEGNGISDAIASMVTDRILIPNYPEGRSTTESLNVAVATAVTCAEFRRRG